MLTHNTIIKEVNDLPVERLEEVYEYIHSLNTNDMGKAKLRKKILSFSGAFSDMSKKDYADLIKNVKKTRATLIDRNIDV